MPPFREEQFLLRLLRGDAIPAADRAGIDAPAFAALCQRHRVTGLAVEAMTRAGGDWPADLTGPLGQSARKILLDNIVLVKALRDLAALLRRQQVPFLVLKGASLLGFLYPQLQLRFMTDLDLLIAREDWPRVAESLRRERYRMPTELQESYYGKSWYHQTVETPTFPSCFVEFHWNLESTERSRIRPDELFQDAVQCRIEDEPLLRLADDHLLLHLALHLAHHHDQPLLHWVEDLRRLLARGTLDWDRIEATARLWGVRNCLAYSFRYLERAFPGSSPAAARRFSLSPSRRLLLSALATSDPTLPHRALAGRALRHVVSMALLDRWWDAARYVVVHTGLRLGSALRLRAETGIHGPPH